MTRPTKPTGFTEFAAQSRCALEIGGNAMETPIAILEDFAALHPFFHIIQEGLAGHVEADHLFERGCRRVCPGTASDASTPAMSTAVHRTNVIV
ncbi:MAG: hypothetical protein QOF83_3665 [Solirubrobacteraceae bacterium]|nr:hypothetical protein [Solirubrobacteraceae bacterium]